jgi:fucose 4-O-acetylase-like acetyltransferase
MEATIKKERIQYIDALRGFTMLLVVFAHVETFSFQYMENATFLGEFFKLFRMPLFFFISGFIT